MRTPGTEQPAQADLIVRQPEVDLSRGFERHWVGGDAYRSTVFNSLSLLFPVGEQFFIDAVRRFAPRIRAMGLHTLAEDIDHFIGQEATHRHLHSRYNAHLKALGYDDWNARTMAAYIQAFEGKAPKADLAGTAGYEHFTALLGDGLLRHPSWTAGMAPEMRKLWLWHAAEELEHKAVAYDTYMAVDGRYWLRIVVFLYVTLEFTVFSTVQMLKMLHHDGQLLKWRTWASAARFWFGREGMVWHTLPHWLAYFKPSFHPWQHDNRALLMRWRTEHAADYREVHRPTDSPLSPTPPQGA
ncbi:metal-dependent hydrolase [Aquabacterium lacunae]|uniref:Metal-dependent hydrolase n=1 Tax=Aquabacterium lacunae TaxID=2528630 RepID=A0A4Q9GYK2_9BURK|nr:metal-dependent hydrolase [Aquabacterium lacunae]TBO29323.1 metal-dependent hydrolase [Aquabacterium lacunae]